MTFINKSKNRIFKATSIGSIAFEVLSKDQDASVLGVASKGIFINPGDKWLLFLSFDPFRGPQTITLDEISPSLLPVSAGQPLRITSQSILFPDIDTTVSVTGSQIWQPPPPPPRLLDNPQRRQNLVRLANEISLKKPGVGLSGFLPLLLGSSNAPSPPGTREYFNWDQILQLQSFLRNGEAPPLTRLLSHLLGAGPGLTPSADDFITGLLLSLNRWQNPLWRADSLRDLNLQVVESAYAKTTSLSANLIECATLGWADERLINVLDLLMTGIAREPESVDHLLGWGNSSGVDAFVGMAVALFSALPPP